MPAISTRYLWATRYNLRSQTNLGLSKMTTTTSYADLKRQIQDLQEQAEKARAAEIVDAKNKIKEIMQTYNLTVLDIGGAPKVTKARKTVAAKYRDSATGETWTGRGRAPKWLEGKTKEDYLIK